MNFKKQQKIVDKGQVYPAAKSIGIAESLTIIIASVTQADPTGDGFINDNSAGASSSTRQFHPYSRLNKRPTARLQLQPEAFANQCQICSKTASADSLIDKHITN